MDSKSTEYIIGYVIGNITGNIMISLIFVYFVMYVYEKITKKKIVNKNRKLFLYVLLFFLMIMISQFSS
jgi:predicted PurR-regulated permease PerM